MKTVLLAFSFLFVLNGFSNKDTLFWQYADTLQPGDIGRLDHKWGHENIKYLGVVTWKAPSGKILELRIVTSYRQITQANGFQDQSILAFVKPNHQLIRSYDMVERKNLPIEIRNNELVYDLKNKGELVAPLPHKIGERFCVIGHTCFSEIKLHHGH